METPKATPAYQRLAQSATATFFRFPFVLASAISGSAISVYLTKEGQPDSTDLLLMRILLALSLALPLFFTITTWSEKRGLSRAMTYGLRVLGAVALIGYCFSLPEDIRPFDSAIIRYILLHIGLHFLVAFAPYTGPDETNAFWQFNKALFLRFLTAFLYSVVLANGL